MSGAPRVPGLVLGPLPSGFAGIAKKEGGESPNGAYLIRKHLAPECLPCTLEGAVTQTQKTTMKAGAPAGNEGLD